LIKKRPADFFYGYFMVEGTLAWGLGIVKNIAGILEQKNTCLTAG
jgi:hypothetical protein